MVKTIYVDILFLINFIINYLLLFTTARITILPFSRPKLILSAGFGALYAVLSFLPSFPFLLFFPVKLLSGLAMILIAFGKKLILKAYLTFLTVSLAFAGIALLAPHTFSQISGGVYYIHLSLPTLLISSFLAYALLHIVFLRRGRENKKLCKVIIRNGDVEILLNALLDTGNSLRDPATNAEVIISDFESLSPLLPKRDSEILREHQVKGFSLALDKLSDAPRFRLIPYKTVGVSFSLMLTFTPDEVFIDDKLSKNAVCAISENTISDGSGYNALI